MTDDKTKWSVLPMEFKKYFDDAQEWDVMETIWFKSNLEGYILNLSTLNIDTTIKNRGTLLKVLDRLVKKQWINKTPLGESGKHNKYSLNREVFMNWMKSQDEIFTKSVERTFEKSALQTLQSPQNGLSEVRITDQNKSAERTVQISKDKVLDNLKDNKVPDNLVPSVPSGKLEDSEIQLRSIRLQNEIKSLEKQAVKENWPLKFLDSMKTQVTNFYLKSSV
jgi:hypothetical protein